MYSEVYLEKSDTIKKELNQRFIKATEKAIQLKANQPSNIFICFAIMETEAWFLGLYHIFEKMDARLTPNFIQDHLNINIKNIDPETTIFHPARTIEQIYNLIGKTYSKKKGHIEAIANLVTKEDYKQLLEKDVCKSFNYFHNMVL